MSTGRGGRGRGAYYRNKYGGGGRGSSGGKKRHAPSSDSSRAAGGGAGGSYQDLKRLLHSIDGKQYPAYHSLETTTTTTSSNDSNAWIHPDGYRLQIGRTQSDPYAPPTRCRVVVPLSVSGLPQPLYKNKIRCIAAADYLLRQLYHSCRTLGADQTLQQERGGGWSSPKGGDIQVLKPTQHVVEQSAVQIDAADGSIQAQVTINLPARGRTILAMAAEHVLDRVLSKLVQDSLKMNSLDLQAFTHHVESVEDQVWLQNQLNDAGLIAFVRNGAILPRVSGADDHPMTQGTVVPFASPPSLQTSFVLPNAGTEITGMGIPKGITLICGGGFHGKSTLLHALQLGIYPKVPGDGREFCVSSPRSVKIRAEDGRWVSHVDISAFLNNLPFDKDTTQFSTADASGSTSQASNIVESIELGADTLLIDEDTCATNFMIRDSKMMQLVANEKEPITPFVRVAPSLFQEQGVSTVLVIGGSGDYFDIADHVLVMDCYKCVDATDRAKDIVASNAKIAPPVPFGEIPDRYPVSDRFRPNGKVKVQAQGILSYGETDLNLQAMEQIVSVSQTYTIASALEKCSALQSSDMTLRASLEALETSIEDHGLDFLAPGQFNGGFTRPRLIEIGGAVNRLRRDGAIHQR